MCSILCCTRIADVNSNPSCGLASGTAAPLLLILGYANGIQIWMIPVSVLSPFDNIYLLLIDISTLWILPT